MSIKKSDFENYLSTYYLESNGVKLSLEGLLICVGNIGLKVIDWKTIFQEEAEDLLETVRRAKSRFLHF